MIGLLTGWKGYVAAAVMAGVTAWSIQGWRKDAAIERERAAHHQAVAIAHAQTREIEQRRQQEIEHVRTEAQQQIAQAVVDAGTAGATADRLRDELARVRGTASRACTSNGSTATIDTVGVLIDMLTGVESVGREIAEYADRARIAGLACEKAYDSLQTGK